MDTTCSCCGEPSLPHLNSRRYRRAHFCSPDCRRKYEGRRDRFRGRRRILKMIEASPLGILETAFTSDDMPILNALRVSKLVTREQVYSGPYWCLTEAGRRSAALVLVHRL